jgi:hypothetical protein
VPERERYNLLNQAMEGGWDRQRVREAARAELGPNRSRTSRPPGFSRHVHQFRLSLRDVQPHDLMEGDRRELRLLFSELSLLARAPKERRRPVFPPLNAS